MACDYGCVLIAVHVLYVIWGGVSASLRSCHLVFVDSRGFGVTISRAE